MGYLNLVGSFVYKEPLFRSKLDALAENDAQLKTDGWAQNTKLVFYQATVPTGWTQDASQNDKALRVVAGGSGGTAGGTQALSSTIMLAHTHAIPADDGHTHAYANHTHSFPSAVTPSGSGNNSVYVYFDNAGIFYKVSVAGSTSRNILKAIMSTPGSITLGSQPSHDHGGATDSQLADTALAYCDIIIGTRNAVSGTYTDLTSFWHTGDKIDFDPFIEYGNNDAYTHGALMPAGTVSIFAQGSPPTGWTKLLTADDRFLRIVSGAGGGTGGTQPISSGLQLAHTHNVTAVSDHNHSIPNHQHLIDQTVNTVTAATTGSLPELNASPVQANGSGELMQTSDSGPTSTVTAYKTRSTSSGSGSTSAAGAHTHQIPSQLATILFSYVDVIQCSKDSSGAPYSYTDMTAAFAWKNLVSYQRLDSLAKNDAYIEYHTTPISTAMLFFMASPPTGWVKQTAHDDIGLRIVSGSSGGIVGGGSQLISQTITLAHAHTIVADGGHTHSADHTHPLDSQSQTANAITGTSVDSRGSSKFVGTGSSGGGFTGKTPLGNVSAIPDTTGAFPNPPTADPDHSHGATTDTKLSNVQLAYADVIWCTKS